MLFDFEFTQNLAKAHEMQHVAIHRDTFHSFVADASDYTGVCFSKPKANCFSAVITVTMLG